MLALRPRRRGFALALCLVSAAAAQTVEREVRVDGAARDYLLHVPKDREASRVLPLVMFLHGRGGSAARASRRYGFRELADRHGFLVAYPEAPDRSRGWRPEYYMRAERGRASESDLPFLEAVLDDVARDHAVDPRRIYACGHSAGGIMSHALAGALAPRIAAIGVVAGSIGIRRSDGGKLTITQPAAPVSVIAMHGRLDRIIPYDEVHGRNAAYAFFISAPDSAAFWAARNGCGPTPEETELLDGRVIQRRWTGGRQGTSVELLTFTQGGHAWPSRRSGVSASQRMWEFFVAHPKPETTTVPASKPAAQPKIERAGVGKD